MAPGLLYSKIHRCVMADFNVENLSGQWIHSFEEDTSTEVVYRPANFPFNRSRGRTEFVLNPNGKIINNSPGQTDLPEATAGDWHIEGERLFLDYGQGIGESHRIKEVTAEKLILFKP
jgi:hypothetical protein